MLQVSTECYIRRERWSKWHWS